MDFTSNELSHLIGAYLWPFCRIGALLMVMPLFGSKVVPVRVRLALTLALTVVIAPVIPATSVAALSVEGGLLIIQQFLIGFAMALVLQMVFQAFAMGGQIVATQMGLGFASLIDPQNGVNISMVSQIYTILITLVFLGLNGHLVVIQVLAESFYILPLGVEGVSLEGFWQLAERRQLDVCREHVTGFAGHWSIVISQFDLWRDVSRRAPTESLFHWFPPDSHPGILGAFIYLAGCPESFR